MKLSVIITTFLYASTATNVAATYDSHDGIANAESERFDESGDRITPSISDFNIEDFETMLLSTNTNPATCTSNCRCRSNPSCTLFACKSNCICQTGSCMMPQCTSNCKCKGASCNMPMCRNNCKCQGQGGSCNIPMCRRNCNCQSGSCNMPMCRNNCKCLGGCFSSEQEEFLLAMEQDVGASDQIEIGTHDVPKLRGAKQATPAAVLDTDTAGALENAATLTADTLSAGASNLAAHEAAIAARVANDSLKHAAEVTTDALNW